MQMKPYWIVGTPYDGEKLDHWQSQSQIMAHARELGLAWNDYKWMSGKSTPANWLGYNAENPSPGRRIDVHYWAVYDEEKAMILYVACGSEIRKVEPKSN